MSHDLKFEDNPSQAEKLKRIKAECKDIGITFKKEKIEDIDGTSYTLFQFIDKKSKEIRGNNWTVNSAYDALNEEGYWFMRSGGKFSAGEFY